MRFFCTELGNILLLQLPESPCQLGQCVHWLGTCGNSSPQEGTLPSSAPVQSCADSGIMDVLVQKSDSKVTSPSLMPTHKEGWPARQIAYIRPKKSLWQAREIARAIPFCVPDIFPLACQQGQLEKSLESTDYRLVYIAICSFFLKGRPSPGMQLLGETYHANHQ